jgi:hypothetical protein
MPKNAPKWLEQGTQRDLGAELLGSIREMKAGLIGCVTLVDVQGVTQVMDDSEHSHTGYSVANHNAC